MVFCLLFTIHVCLALKRTVSDILWYSSYLNSSRMPDVENAPPYPNSTSSKFHQHSGLYLLPGAQRKSSGTFIIENKTPCSKENMETIVNHWDNDITNIWTVIFHEKSYSSFAHFLWKSSFIQLSWNYYSLNKMLLFNSLKSLCFFYLYLLSL